MHEQNENIDKEMEKIETLNMKNITSNRKIDYRIEHIIDEAEERICELEHMPFEII